MNASRLFTRVSLLLCAATVALSAAACNSSGNAGAPAASTGSARSASAAPAASPSPSANAGGAGGYEARLLTWGRQLAQCARSHGIPNFPDPRVIRNGDGVQDADFPGIPKTDLVRAQETCVTVMRRHPQAPPPTRPPAAATLRHMRQFAACMRQHGAGPFPDPKANGTFPILGTQFASLAPYANRPVPAALQNALDQCWRYQVDFRIHRIQAS
jgi:hypothetical protein